jgi:hypothetical protein
LLWCKEARRNVEKIVRRGIQVSFGNLIGEGVAIEWLDLNEDLSLKGFIKSSYLNRALRTLKGNQENIFA